MAKPYNMKKSRFPLPVGIAKHRALTWNNATIVWGGFNSEEDESLIFINLSGKWIKKVTSGEIPRRWQELAAWPCRLGNLGNTAQVINDKMYVIAESIQSTIYTLDLHTFIWTNITPNGPRPSLRSNLTSWVYNEKMYNFAGDGELFIYNISNNTWEWPNQGGECPSPSQYNRFSSIINDDTAFILGGNKEYGYWDNLFILDMVTMMWTKVHGNISTEVAPYSSPYFMRTLIRISNSEAIFLETSEDFPVCWLLNLQNAKQLLGPASIWTKISLRFPIMYDYAAVLEPMSKELLIIGGYPKQKQHIYTKSSDVLKIPMRLSTLKNLAMDCVARNNCTNDPRLASDQMPQQLKEEIEMCKQEIIGPESLCMCTKERGCTKCQVVNEPPNKKRKLLRN